MKISIVIPVYNGAATIGPLANRLLEILGRDSLQIVLVNDGSRDDSHEICCRLHDSFPQNITYLNLAKNFGEHNAVMAGLNHANGDFVVIMDDDAQNPPEEVLSLVSKAKENNYDIVYSSYKIKQHHFFRNLGSRFTNRVASILLDKPPNLYLSSFKCLSRFAVKEIIKYQGPYPYIDGLILRCTKNIGVVEVSHAKRQAGRSGYTFRKLVHLWLNMFVNFSIMPLRISSLLGLFASCLGVIFSIVVIIEKFKDPHLPIGWPSMIVVTLVFAGVQLFMLGLFGEYLGRLFLSSNQTPQYVIREIFKEDRKA